MKVNINGTWHDVNNSYVNVNGTWHNIIAQWVNVGGAWRQKTISFVPQLRSTITTPGNPHDVCVNKVTNTIYATDPTNAAVYVINGATNTVTKTISLSSYEPRYIAVNENTNMIYVTSSNSSRVNVINGATNVVTTTILLDRNDITKLVVNPVTNKIYVGGPVSGIAVINGTNNTVSSYVTGSEGDLAINTITNKIYATANTNVFIIDGSTDSLVQTIVGTSGCIALNENTNMIYVSEYSNKRLAIIDGSNNIITEYITGIGSGGGLEGIQINKYYNQAYVVNYADNKCYVIDLLTKTIITQITVGTSPFNLAVNTNNGRIYVANYGSSSISVLY